MKATGTLYPGTEPVWGLQPKNNQSRPEPSRLQRGWDRFYDGGKDEGRPHMHTYGPDAEKFFETFKLPHVEPRPAKPLRPGAMDIGRPGESWGIGGSLPSGTLHLEPFPAKEAKWSCKMYIAPKPAVGYLLEDTMGRKKHVYGDGGVDCARRRSEHSFLEDALQRRGRVTEEMVSEPRTIHRMAPPGMKGFMGAEYSLDYWKMDGVVPRTKMRMTREEEAARALAEAAERTHARLGKPKSFKQKRAEEEMAEQVQLVGTLKLDYEMLEDDEDLSPREKEKDPM